MSQRKESLTLGLFRSKSESTETISHKPPLSKRRKRKGSNSVLSSITNLTFNSFGRKKSKFDDMGSFCAKGGRALSPHINNHSPTKKCNSKVSPSHTDVKVTSCNGSDNLKQMFYRSDITIEHVADIVLNGNGVVPNGIDNIEKGLDDDIEKGVDDNIEDLDSYPDEVFNEPGDESESAKTAESKSTETVNGSINHADEVSLLDPIIVNKQNSLPDLRCDKKHWKPSKRLSQGETLKSSLGSTNLLEIKKTFVENRLRPSRKKASSDNNVVSIEKRRKRLLTVENRIDILEEGQVNYYEVLEELGRGSFGSVCKCRSHKDNNYYAMKMISKKRLMRKNRQLARKPGSKVDPLEPLYKEVAILKKIDHPNVVKLYEVIDDIQVDNFYMIFELVTYGVVIDVPTENVIPEDKARQLFRELLLGIEYLHYTKIVHRDIKPSNLLLDNNNHLKIADFGVSNMFQGDDDLLNKYAGSPAFQSPEVLHYESRVKYSGKAVDIWAMGITLYCFLYGKCPFYSNNFGELCNMIKNDLVSFPDAPILNPQVFDLISRMLSKEAKDRINMAEMKDHPWVTEGGDYILPSTKENCTFIEVTDEEVQNSIKTKISRLSSLVVAKSILKGKSFLKGRPSKTEH